MSRKVPLERIECGSSADTRICLEAAENPHLRRTELLAKLRAEHPEFRNLSYRSMLYHINKDRKADPSYYEDRIKAISQMARVRVERLFGKKRIDGKFIRTAGVLKPLTLRKRLFAPMTKAEKYPRIAATA